MAGRINQTITRIIAERSKGNEVLVRTTKTKLVLKGINPDSYNDSSPDDPAVLSALSQIAHEMGVQI